MRIRIALAAVVTLVVATAPALTSSAASATAPVVLRSGDHPIVPPAEPSVGIARSARSDWGTTTCAGVTYDCGVADLDGSKTLGTADLSLWLDLLFAGPPWGATGDFDGSGDLSPADLSIWLCLFFQCPPK